MIAASREELLIARDMLIFLLQNLEFLFNTQNLILNPTSSLEFLRVLVDSQSRFTLSLPQEKVEKIKIQFKKLLEKSLVTVKELSKLIGWLSSTEVAVLPESLHFRVLQQQQIQVMVSKSSLEGQLGLSKQAKEELHWWRQNFSLYNFNSLPAQLTINSNVSSQGWEIFMSRASNERSRVLGGEEILLKCARTKSNQIDNDDLY